MSSTLSSSSSFAAGRVSRIWKLTFARSGQAKPVPKRKLPKEKKPLCTFKLKEALLGRGGSFES